MTTSVMKSGPKDSDREWICNAVWQGVRESYESQARHGSVQVKQNRNDTIDGEEAENIGIHEFARKLRTRGENLAPNLILLLGLPPRQRKYCKLLVWLEHDEPRAPHDARRLLAIVVDLDRRVVRRPVCHNLQRVHAILLVSDNTPTPLSEALSSSEVSSSSSSSSSS